MNVRKWLGAAIMALALVGLPSEAEAQQAPCDYSVSPTLAFGPMVGPPTTQTDATTTITVTCRQLLSGIINRRVCLSLPAGTAGVSIADRRLGSSGGSIQYQLYSNAARTAVWGALGGSSPPVTVDFTGLTLGADQVIVVTVYGRIFGGQTGFDVGTYESELVGTARHQDYLLVLAPACTSVTGDVQTLTGFTASTTINPHCSFTTAPLQFGTVLGLTGQTAATNISVTCTSGRAYTVTLNAGTYPGGSVNDRRMQLDGSGPATVEYQLYRDSARTQVFGSDASTDVEGTGTGAAQSIPVYGGITGTGPRPAGTYSDTITVTVSF